MLVVSRRNGESVCLGDDVKITVVEIKGSRIRLGITADEETLILRSEKKTDGVVKPSEKRPAKKAKAA
ncbi:MAG: carbon storage regulator [Thermoguttaceae bacterium]|nr:carbon storage regulator [Thermoguttaceae bacterium]